ncbi:MULTISPECIES: hypothetical protein [unclassified Acinetobacter]|uniref:hypothetical protein n=1 Tax=unclassified Acinetobacter TaxID=196816 RepID=UPI00244AA8D8|nr:MULTISPECIES: hypothetical protein [unclassified Acinetobacter]MDH0032530.1 hypothetical protein [Acinetobacter sp. GD04021]MDH0885221.1 hypothetical protein [Acinetobacter sp. GD03873]MDH1084451.1 hypothetical protein [Acinetobacter sp. GD03983]MDH2188339.1 hypothetical protein [Acinetobacter sp. GD03645]MDH2203850.1 hypothetical protein [Acinetobacter sp. GD03647]
MSKKPTDAQQFIEDIGAGVFAKQLGVSVTEVANSVIRTGKAGEINIKLKVTKLTDSQVQIESKLQFNEPLAKGKRVEEHNEQTPMHVNLTGDVTLFANHTGQLFHEKNEKA